MFPSSQLGAGPPRHLPPLHLSLVVQAFPSLHGAVLFVWTQPVAGLHESSVQGLPSAQLTGVCVQPPPPSDVSVVHASPSSHSSVQPRAGSGAPLESRPAIPCPHPSS